MGRQLTKLQKWKLANVQNRKTAKICSPSNHQEAVNDGFSNPVIAEADAYELRLLNKPDQDLGQKFEAFDRDEPGMLTINGWLFSIYDDPEGRKMETI